MHRTVRLAQGNEYGAGVPFACSVGLYFLAFYGLAYSTFPYLVVDRITVWQAASAPESLLIIFVGAAIVLPVIVAYKFKSDLARLRARFKTGRHLDSDPRTIADWNAGKIPVMFAHPASASHGARLASGTWLHQKPAKAASTSLLTMPFHIAP